MLADPDLIDKRAVTASAVVNADVGQIHSYQTVVPRYSQAFRVAGDGKIAIGSPTDAIDVRAFKVDLLPLKFPFGASEPNLRRHDCFLLQVRCPGFSGCPALPKATPMPSPLLYMGANTANTEFMAALLGIANPAGAALSEIFLTNPAWRRVEAHLLHGRSRLLEFVERIRPKPVRICTPAGLGAGNSIHDMVTQFGEASLQVAVCVVAHPLRPGRRPVPGAAALFWSLIGNQGLLVCPYS
jgi:hypothetical protein